ncbi:MAG: hypothetical protein R3E66_22620 [bacterium]
MKDVTMGSFYTLEEISNAPERYLLSPSVENLRALIEGYSLVDSRLRAVVNSVGNSLAGPSWAHASTKVLLANGNSYIAFHELLNLLLQQISTLAAHKDGSEGACADWIAACLPHLRTRPGVVLGRPSVSALYHHAVGYLAALRDLRSTAYISETERFAQFGEWLRCQNGTTCENWGVIIQVFVGEGVEGVEYFVSQWEAFEPGSRLLPPL